MKLPKAEQIGKLIIFSDGTYGLVTEEIFGYTHPRWNEIPDVLIAELSYIPGGVLGIMLQNKRFFNIGYYYVDDLSVPILSGKVPGGVFKTLEHPEEIQNILNP